MSEGPVSLGWYEREHARLTAEIEILKSGGGGGTSGGMDPWQTSVETRLGQLHADVSQLRTDLLGRIDAVDGRLGGRLDDLDRKIDNRFFWLLGTMGAGFVSLLGLYLKLSDQLADIAKAVAALHH